METRNKFKLPVIFAVLIAMIITGCSKNDGVTGPNGMNAQASFQITQQAGYYGGTQFLFNPSADLKISQIICKLDAQQFVDTISFGNSNYVYSKDTTYIINEYTGVENGQQWKFSFTGSIPGQNNANYNTTINYTAQ